MPRPVLQSRFGDTEVRCDQHHRVGTGCRGFPCSVGIAGKGLKYIPQNPQPEKRRNRKPGNKISDHATFGPPFFYQPCTFQNCVLYLKSQHCGVVGRPLGVWNVSVSIYGPWLSSEVAHSFHRRSLDPPLAEEFHDWPPLILTYRYLQNNELSNIG